MIIEILYIFIDKFPFEQQENFCKKITIVIDVKMWIDVGNQQFTNKSFYIY